MSNPAYRCVVVACEHCGAPLVMDLRNRCRSCQRTNGVLRTMRGRTTVTQQGAARIVEGEAFGAPVPGRWPGGRSTASPTPVRTLASDELDLSTLVGGPIRTWSEAEALGLALMRALGFHDAVLTAAGADGGIDAASPSAVCQVKFHVASVGRPAVQQLHGAARGRTAIFLAPSFTGAAQQWAAESNVALFTLDVSGIVRALSPLAIRLIADRSTSRGTTRRLETTARYDQVRRWRTQLVGALRELEMSPAGEGRHRRRLIKTIRSARAALARVDEEMRKLEKVRGARIATTRRTDAQLDVVERTLRALAKELGVSLG